MFLEIVVGLNSWHAMNRTHIFRVFVGRNEVCRNSLLVTACAGPMVYGCMYCARSYNDTLATLKFAGHLHSFSSSSIF